MKNLTLKALAILMATVMLLLPVPVFAADGVTYEKGAALQADAEGLIYTAEYEACAYDYTVYTFEPTETGRYTISSNKLLGIVSYNGMWVTVQPNENTITETSVTWECKSVGQELWIAVLTQGESVIITIEYEPIEVTAIPVIVYENATTPEAFVFDGDSAALVNVNVQDTKIDIPVLGSDGLYRLNEASGPRIFVDLNDAQLSLAAALDYGQLKIGVLENGKIDHYIDYCDAFSQYLECADSATGLYPLTDDLLEIYKDVGAYKNWYSEDGWLGLSTEDAWMFACYYIEGDGIETEWPETDPAKLDALVKTNYTANGSDTVALSAEAEDKSVYSFTSWKKGTYTVAIEGTATKEAWIVNSAGDIVASTNGAVTSKVNLDIETAAGETYYIVTRTSHTAESKVTVSVNYFSGANGDVNGDGRANSKDTMNLKKLIANQLDKNDVSVKGADFDGNGRINSQDLMKLKKALQSN